MTEGPRSEPVTGLVDSLAEALLRWLFPAKAEYANASANSANRRPGYSTSGTTHGTACTASAPRLHQTATRRCNTEPERHGGGEHEDQNTPAIP